MLDFYDPIEPTVFIPDEPISHYVLPDGRIWDIQGAQFISQLPEGAVTDHIQAEPDRTPFQILIDNLKFSGYSLGDITPIEDLQAAVRSERNRRIAATDYLLMSDYPITEDRKAKVITYRQALRDLPAQVGFPWDGGGEKTPWPVLEQ